MRERIEALASGTPVVAHDNEITRWILEDHAHLVDTHSQPLLVEALKKALVATAGSTAPGAAFAISRYSWTTVAKEYRDFFTKVVRRTRPTG